MNVAQIMPGAFTRDRDLQFPIIEATSTMSRSIGSDRVTYADATRAATEVFGDAIQSNLILLGIAYQQGLIPVSADSIEKAVTLNGVSVQASVAAFQYGRRLTVESGFGALAQKPAALAAMSIDEIIAHRVTHLTAYQDRAYALRYKALVEQIAVTERELLGAPGSLTRQVAISLAKLMAYKDEYEVARLYTSAEFKRTLDQEFDGITRLELHLAPPFLSRPDPVSGRPAKRRFGPWILKAFLVLKKLRRLRGSIFDVFGYAAERRAERALIAEYCEWIKTVAGGLKQVDYDAAVRIAALPQDIRGFGPIKMAAIDAYRIRRAELQGAGVRREADAHP